MDQCNPACTDNPAERDLGAVLDGKLNESAMCLGGQNSQPYSGVHQAQHSQLDERSDCLTILSIGLPH